MHIQHQKSWSIKPICSRGQGRSRRFKKQKNQKRPLS